MGDLSTLLGNEPLLFAGVAGVLGLMVGSFLNVVIYRLPLMLERDWRAQSHEMLGTTPEPTATESRFTLSVPASACPACKAPIRPWQNIPVVSYVMLGGRCAACRARISVRYPVVELLTGLLSAWVAWHFGLGVPAIGGLIMTWTLIALSGIDIDHQLLPDGLTIPLMWIGLLAAVVAGAQPGATLPVWPADAILGAVCGYLSLWLVYQLFKLVTGKEGMGYGDFKLFAALGAWLGWKLLPLIILLSAAAGALIGIGMIVIRGRDRAAPMPFGPYLAIAGWFAMMYGDSLVDSYLRVSGIHR